ncbi:hypothetical protein [Haloarcula marina]|uniref:hypothetical protein n=1 Tax=Haloarcula marina TaxID=2961574 RepID=UPI0020B85FCC|nr:hypothetical protein [Halomicroarcula marina]
MTDISLDGRTLAAVETSDSGTVDGDTRLHFQQDSDRVSARYAGGDILDGYLTGTFDGDRWDVRYVQLEAGGETATGHSVGEVTLRADGRVRVEDEWEWESREGTGETVLVEVED